MGYCLDCRVEMHYGMTCTEFKVDQVNNNLEDDKLSVQLSESGMSENKYSKF